MMMKRLSLAVFALSLAGCEVTGKKDPNFNPNEDKYTIVDGVYKMTAMSAQAFDTAGNEQQVPAIQVSGNFTWEMRNLGSNRYEATARGAVKFVQNNSVVGGINCTGARDVYRFEVGTAGSISNILPIESGCPQGVKLASATDLSLEAIDVDTFVFNDVEQANGVRVIYQYTFRK